jgi:hypothetical protein
VLDAALKRRSSTVVRAAVFRVRGSGTNEVVPFPVVALPKSSEGWGRGIPFATRGGRRTSTGAEARLLFWALYAALKRRSSTVVHEFVAALRYPKSVLDLGISTRRVRANVMGDLVHVLRIEIAGLSCASVQKNGEGLSDAAEG